MDKFFSLFGKVMVVTIILALLGGGAYYFGSISQRDTHTPTAISETTQRIPVTPLSTDPSSQTEKKITAGAKTQLFSPYTITLPNDWSDTRQTDPASKADILTITKQNYTLTISQAAGGAGTCIFPGDTPQPMSPVFSSSTDIPSAGSLYKRGTTDNMAYTICEQKGNGFVMPTSIGYITYTVPKPVDMITLAEMDQMIASLNK